jgi:hypothetical protein
MWQRIETAPENTEILTWSSYNDEQPYCVDRFQWVVEIETEVESDTRNATGRRRIIQEREKRIREWLRGWGAEWWQPLPGPPSE